MLGFVIFPLKAPFATLVITLKFIKDPIRSKRAIMHWIQFTRDHDQSKLLDDDVKWLEEVVDEYHIDCLKSDVIKKLLNLASCNLYFFFLFNFI